MDIYEEILAARKINRPYALATIVKTIGCTPRPAGTKMLVFADGSSLGTIGGGTAERMAVQDAVNCIKSGRPALKRYSPQIMKEADIEPDCEKVIDVFIEPGESRQHLYILGAGHVARILMKYASKLDYYITIVDNRDPSDYADQLQEADEIITVSSFEDLSVLDPVAKSYYIISTGTHEDDGKALESVLKFDSSYIGMMGAKHKFVPIFSKLREAGYKDEQLMEIYAPAGLDTGGRTLDEIAVSVMAEIQMVRYGRTGIPLRDKKRGEMFPEQS